jgi:hypothetical protein
MNREECDSIFLFQAPPEQIKILLAGRALPGSLRFVTFVFHLLSGRRFCLRCPTLVSTTLWKFTNGGLNGRICLITGTVGRILWDKLNTPLLNFAKLLVLIDGLRRVCKE